MTKRIMYLVIPVVIFTGTGLIAVQNFFSSFPPSKTVIEKFAPSENIPAAIDLTESFFDDSGSMKGYFSKEYIQFLRILKSHIREKGNYRYYAFSDPETIIEGDEWESVEDIRFYRQNNTDFDKVLDSILMAFLLDSAGDGNQAVKNYVIITDGIQDVSKKQDYSRMVNKVSNIVDAGLIFQIVAIQLPFRGHKYPEGGGFLPYEGESPLFCYIFSYQHDFGKDLYKKLTALNLPVKFLGFGNRNIHASIKQFIDTAKNRNGSENTFKKFRDETPVTYLVSRSGTGGTLVTKVALNVQGVTIDSSGFSQKTPEFCGQCLPIGGGDVDPDLSKSIPNVTVTTTGIEPSSDGKGNLGIEYSLYFKKWDDESKIIACDLTLCNWLAVDPPAWVYAWSSDCDNSRSCFEGKTPFLINMINPVLMKAVRKYTLGYAVIRNL